MSLFSLFDLVLMNKFLNCVEYQRTVGDEIMCVHILYFVVLVLK